MNDIHSGIQNGAVSVLHKTKRTLFNAGEAMKHYVHSAYESVAGEDDIDVDLEANSNYNFQRSFQAINQEPHHDFIQQDV